MEYSPITTNQHIPDTKRVSEWAAIALHEGRIELGAALARIAVQALRVDSARNAAVTASVPAPIVDEVPMLRAVPAWRETLDAAAAAHGTPEEEAAAMRAYTGTPEPDRTKRIPTPRRCTAPYPLDGVETICGGGAFWSEELNGWRHVDEGLDRHHGVEVRL